MHPEHEEADAEAWAKTKRGARLGRALTVAWVAVTVVAMVLLLSVGEFGGRPISLVGRIGFAVMFVTSHLTMFLMGGSVAAERFVDEARRARGTIEWRNR